MNVEEVRICEREKVIEVKKPTVRRREVPVDRVVEEVVARERETVISVQNQNYIERKVEQIIKRPVYTERVV